MAQLFERLRRPALFLRQTVLCRIRTKPKAGRAVKGACLSRATPPLRLVQGSARSDFLSELVHLIAQTVGLACEFTG